MPRVNKIVPAAGLAALLAVSVITPASTASGSTGGSAQAGVGALWRSPVEVNKAMVAYYYDQLFNHGNYAVIDQYVSPDLIQHNPGVADGAEAQRKAVMGLRAQFPNSQSPIIRVIGQGDLVLLQHQSILVPGTAGSAVMDIFRVSHGKIVEHWDTVQTVPASTASGNDMFAELSSSGDQSTVLSEAVVLSYYARLTGGHDLRAVDRYVSPSLIQHDPALANGSAAVKAAFAARLQANPQLHFSSLKVIADHDLVSLRYHVQNGPDDLGQAVNDIYRVSHGKIVEHWNVVQNVPATSANDNTMF